MSPGKRIGTKAPASDCRPSTDGQSPLGVTFNGTRQQDRRAAVIYQHFRYGGEREPIPDMPDANTPDTETPTPPAAPQRLHKATYASDKRNPGQYLIRIIGPTAAAFAGREVPVVRKDDSESSEKLLRCIWTGTDEETNRPVALYTFEAKPRDTHQEDLPF